MLMPIVLDFIIDVSGDDILQFIPRRGIQCGLSQGKEHYVLSSIISFVYNMFLTVD